MHRGHPFALAAAFLALLAACSPEETTNITQVVPGGPAAPVITSTTPASPSSTDTTPAINGFADPGVSVRLHTTPVPSSAPVATGTANAVTGAFSIGVTVTANTSTTFYASAADASGAVSGPSVGITYVHDGATPSAPASLGTSPPSPSNVNTPWITGTAEAGTIVRLYTNPAGTGAPVATGIAAASGDFTLAALVPDNSTTTFYLTATDAAGNPSPVSGGLTYVEHSIPPPAPVLIQTLEGSPANFNTPTLVGTAEPGATVRIYPNASCSGTPVGSVTADPSGNFSLLLNVADDTTTTYSGLAIDTAGNASPCSTTTVTYIEDSTPPLEPFLIGTTPLSPNTSAAPSVIGFSEPYAAMSIYAGAACTGMSVATGAADSSGFFSIAVSVADGSTTTFYASATDAAGNLSLCSTTSVTYVHQHFDFAPAVNYGVGTGPSSVAIGDFNTDGKLDLVTANSGSGNVSILLGDGTGNFGAATNYPAGTNPVSVAVGDFNGDLKPDLAVTDYVWASVLILLGDGFGAFGAPTSFTVGNSPIHVAVGNFDGDLDLDLAVANRTSSNVSILLGDGTGSFGAATNYPAGTNTNAVALGDYNGDLKLDLAVASGNSANVNIRLGDGTGLFGAATNVAAPAGAHTFITAADLSGDGKLDLAVSRGIFLGQVAILVGDGAGGFGASTEFAVGASPYSVAVADFNSDGKPDLVTANNASANVSVLPANGDATFQAPLNFAVGLQPFSVATADFNGDGKPDIVTANWESNNVSVLINQ